MLFACGCSLFNSHVSRQDFVISARALFKTWSLFVFSHLTSSSTIPKSRLRLATQLALRCWRNRARMLQFPLPRWVVNHLRKQNCPRGGYRPLRPPLMQSCWIASGCLSFSTGSFSINGIQRKRHLNEFLGRLDGVMRGHWVSERASSSTKL